MNQIFTHPGQPQMQVEVILASRVQATPAQPLYTVRMRYPRIIHSELMTHRVFSRNARSSRAVPVERMIQEIRDTPFIPWHWGKNQKGMQADETCSELVNVRTFWQREDGTHSRHYGTNIDHTNSAAWLAASEYAVEVAHAFTNAGYHKQITNRLLEPFMWIDTLVSSTEWENFLWLRDHKDAEPHLQDLARLVEVALRTAEIRDLMPGEWHLPYITDPDWAEANTRDTRQFTTEDSPLGVISFLRQLSAARCARISYTPFDGDASYERELARYDSLVSSDRIHASPLEHQATPDTMVTASIDLFEDDNEELTPDETLDEQRVYRQKQLHGNFKGWIQARKLVPGENHTS